MSFFKEVDGEAAVIVHNGVFRQVPLFTRDGYLYAKISGGYVRLMADGSTTKDKMRLEFMSWNGKLCRDPIGRLCTGDVPRASVLDDKRQQILLGAADA